MRIGLGPETVVGPGGECHVTHFAGIKRLYHTTRLSMSRSFTKKITSVMNSCCIILEFRNSMHEVAQGDSQSAVTCTLNCQEQPRPGPFSQAPQSELACHQVYGLVLISTIVQVATGKARQFNERNIIMITLTCGRTAEWT